MTHPGHFSSRRQAGVLVPLFSCHSSRSWGIGEFGDMPVLADWLCGAGLRTLQLLPLNELAPGQTSPYSAISAMALDPIFIHLPAVPDFAALGGEGSLDAAQIGMLAHVRAHPGVDHRTVRTLKDRALRSGFDRFLEAEWARETLRATELRAFLRDQAWWLDDYAMFRAVRHMSDGKDWREWPEGLRRRDAATLTRVGRDHGREILYRQYLQWNAHTQWQAARHAACGLRVYGDFPFMVAADSADVWSHQHLFSFESTVGAPPDAFSKEGQNWKLPVFRWDVLRERHYDWFCNRARRTADLFNGFRVDHVVGLFRTWVFPHDGSPPHFTPEDQLVQLEQGRAVLSVIQQAGADVIAEDLGTIPDFVRTALSALGIPGYKVLRWERNWDAPGRPFVDPIGFPALSLATSGTHDTDTLAEWWTSASPDERRAVLKLASTRQPVTAPRLTITTPFVPLVRDLLLELLFEAGSDMLVLPIQDIFGWTYRINVPAIVDDTNWTWKLPWRVDELVRDSEALERQQALLSWSRRHGRADDPSRL